MSYPKCMSQTFRKARKQHKCCDCHKDINIGEHYSYTSGVWDEPHSFKQCMDCYKIVIAILQKMDDRQDDEPAFGDLCGYFQNHICSSFKGEEALSWFSKKLGIDKHKINAVAKLV